MSAALPCPYCKGNNRAFVEGKPLNGSMYSVTCMDCHVCGPIKRSKAEAIQAWNEMQTGGKKECQ